MNTHSAFFSTAQDLAKFFKATSGVSFTRDAYEFCGSLWVDFNLGVLTEDQAQDKIAKAGGVMIAHA